MFTRMDRGRTRPEKLDEFAAFIRDDVLPELRVRDGYVSAWIGIDRASGKVTVSTTWRSRETREACNATLLTVLKNAGRFGLVPIEIELYDDVALDAGSRPRNPSARPTGRA